MVKSSPGRWKLVLALAVAELVLFSTPPEVPAQDKLSLWWLAIPAVTFNYFDQQVKDTNTQTGAIRERMRVAPSQSTWENLNLRLEDKQEEGRRAKVIADLSQVAIGLLSGVSFFGGSDRTAQAGAFSRNAERRGGQNSLLFIVPVLGNNESGISVIFWRGW